MRETALANFANEFKVSFKSCSVILSFCTRVTLSWCRVSTFICCIKIIYFLPTQKASSKKASFCHNWIKEK